MKNVGTLLIVVSLVALGCSKGSDAPKKAPLKLRRYISFQLCCKPNAFACDDNGDMKMRDNV